MTSCFRDDVNKRYLLSQKVNNILVWLFIFNTLITFGALLIPECFQECIINIQIIISVLSVGFSICDDGVFWYAAEKARRRNCIQVAFDIVLDVEQTEGYYNNECHPSIEKYALNTFESVFHSIRIAEKMTPKSVVKSIVAATILFLVCRYVANGNVLLIATQTVFSTYIISDTIMLLLYRNRLNEINSEFMTQFLTLGVSVDKQMPILLASVVEYEAIKAHYKVRLDSSIYHKINDSVSQEWNIMLEEIASAKGTVAE